MRAIFLDIDGVLNHPGIYADDLAPWRREEGEKIAIPIADECMARLNRLISETEASVVISSSWRLFARWQDLGPALNRHGMVGDVIGETPDLINNQEWLEAWRRRHGEVFQYERLERGLEIAEWLRCHPEVTAFVVLDDCSDMEGVAHRFVKCDPTVGLDDPDVERAKWMLSKGVTP